MNTTLTGDLLEKEIFELFERLIATDQFISNSKHCKVFQKKGYFSKDRGSDIIFDVSIEFYLPGVTQYSLVMLIECKNYSSAVPVSDIEEFYAKVQQVASANAKAVLASNAAFQSGTRYFAESKGIGLLRYFDPSSFKWELHRSPSVNSLATYDSIRENVLEGLSLINFSSKFFDLYLQSPTGNLTNSLRDFVSDTFAVSSFTTMQIKSISNRNRKPSHQVPYLSHDELEKYSLQILHEIGYCNGEVSLEDICARESDRAGLLVRMDASIEQVGLPHSPLGQISFAPLEILIYKQSVENTGRDRFTLAHELAHHLLSHSKYLSREFCDDTDFSLQRVGLSAYPDLARLEYQANYFAACLLMPKASFIRDFRVLVDQLGISNRGYGDLFVDDQPCNQQNYLTVTRELMTRYGVSRAATSIRLEGLKLLHDARLPPGVQSAQNFVKKFPNIARCD